jgi:photosystem II stability/assembly factor-like uncharacterized protein
MRIIVVALAVLLVASGGTLLESSRQDTTVEWRASDGPYTGSVLDFEVAGSGALFAVTTHGLHRSLDDGMSWGACAKVAGTFVRILADRRLLVGPSPTGVLTYVDESCRTVGTVTLPSDFNSPKTINAFAISSTGRLLASRWNIGLFLSDDSGQSWRKTVLPPAPNAAWVKSIVSTGPGRLVASTPASVFRSTDNGETWLQTRSTVAPGKLALDATGALLGGTGDGVWRSLDEGETWTRAGLDGRLVWTLTAKRTGSRRADRWFAAVQQPAGADNAVFRSDDRGAVWSPIASPARGRINALTFTPAGTLILGASSGFLRSSDEGRNWKGQGVLRAALRTIVSGAQETVIGGNPGAWRSSDGGQTWEPILVYLNEGNRAAGLGVEPYAFAFARENRLLVATQNGVATSIDRGTTWKRSGLWQSTMALLELPDGTLMAGTQGGIFRSTDGGAKWVEQSIGLSEYDVRGLAVLESGEVLAATLHGIFLSANNAKNWRSATAGLLRLSRSPVLASGAATVAVAGTDTGVFELDQASAVWKQAFTTKSPVLALAWDPYGQLWVGTASSGMSTLRRVGSDWTESQAGLPGESILAIAIDDGAHVIATTSNGTFRARLTPPR